MTSHHNTALFTHTFGSLCDSCTLTNNKRRSRSSKMTYRSRGSMFGPPHRMVCSLRTACDWAIILSLGTQGLKSCRSNELQRALAAHSDLFPHSVSVVVSRPVFDMECSLSPQTLISFWSWNQGFIQPPPTPIVSSRTVHLHIR
jgi:hypothetical protein